ncbi:MAG: hypothetical protein HRT81_10385 [Henriciella sp.]|nr:hypothetical protein [Henriciella sp.]
MSPAWAETEAGGGVTRATQFILIGLSVVGIFAAGFASGVAYTSPEPGLYQLTRVDCSDHDSTVDCMIAQPPALFTTTPSADKCASSGEMVELLIRCRDSAVEGLGSEEACTDGTTMVPRNLDHLDEQIPFMQQIAEQNCALSETTTETSQ